MNVGPQSASDSQVHSGPGKSFAFQMLVKKKKSMKHALFGHIVKYSKNFVP